MKNLEKELIRLIKNANARASNANSDGDSLYRCGGVKGLMIALKAVRNDPRLAEADALCSNWSKRLEQLPLSCKPMIKGEIPTPELMRKIDRETVWFNEVGERVDGPCKTTCRDCKLFTQEKAVRKSWIGSCTKLNRIRADHDSKICEYFTEKP